MRLSLLLIAGLAMPAAAQTAVPSPKMTAAEAVQMFGVAGFTLTGRQLHNRCGHPANPRVAFVDLNGDGKPEAHVADVDPRCYAAPGAYYALLSRNAAGQWQQMIAEDAIISFDRTRTAGWLDVEVKPGNGNCVGARHYRAYGYTVPCTVPDGATAKAAFAAAGRQTAPAAPGAGRGDDKAGIMRAAGFKLAGGKWHNDCDDPESGGGPAAIDEIRDINGDGRPDAVVTQGGSFCYGNTGGGYFLVSKQANGSWRLITQSIGIATFQKTRGVDGWPDIEIGGPGFCFPLVRWNGTEYKVIGHVYEGKACRPPR